MKKNFRTLHRLSALVLGIFTVLHVVNHVIAIGGIDAHIAFMSALRKVYQHPIIEGILILAVIGQVISGITGLRNAWKRKGVARLQAISGLYLVLFLIGHTTATALVGRRILGLDTNFYFAATTFQFAWLPLLFVPYYFSALLAIGVHISAALYWRSKAIKLEAPTRRWLVALPATIAVLAAVAIILAFSGAFYPIQIPAQYTAPYLGLQ